MDEVEVRRELRRLKASRSKLEGEIKRLDVERRRVVLVGMEELGLSAAAMVDDSGLSQQRLSQIKRDARL